MVYRATSALTTDALGRSFYPAAIVSVVVVLVSVYFTVGAAFAVFGLYALFGILGGAALYYGFDDGTESSHWAIDGAAYRLGVYAAVAVTIGIVSLTGEAMAVLLGLLIGYALVVGQLLSDPVPERLVPQLTALFLLSPVTKYLTAGRYIGHGDLLFHTRVVEDLVTTGSLASIGYASYQNFPGLHVVASSVASLAGLGPHDGIMLTGLAVWAVVIPAVYLIIVRITNHPQLALCTAFALVLLDDLSFFASYVFPQSLAMAMIVMLGLLATLAVRDEIKWRIASVFAVMAGVLSVTHHLTQVLVFPVVALGIVLYAIRGREELAATVRSRPVALFGFAAAVSGFRLVQTGFIDRLLAKAGQIIGGGTMGGYTEGTVFSFGRPARSSSVGHALEWLVSPYGLYITVLLVLFSLGFVVYLRSSERPVAHRALFGCGAVAALLVFETPISIQSLIRIRFPWLFVFAFVLAIGLLQLIRYAGRRPVGVIVLALVVATAISAPLVTADNYYDLDPRPTVQSSFTDQEIAELRALSGYVDSEERTVGGFWITEQVLERYGVNDVHNARIADGEVMLPAGHFVYRSAWPGHKVHFTVGTGEQLYSNTLYVATAWLDRRIEQTNKVYTVGGTSLRWHPSERPF